MFIKRFWRSEDGAALIFVTITLPAIIGFALLTIDGGRLFNEQTSLQNAADAFALAAAAELDGEPDAICRASTAIGWPEPGCDPSTSMIANQSKFSDQGFADVDISQVRYLHALPADDSAPITADFEVDPALPLEERSIEARFVEVRVQPARLLMMFPITFFTPGGDNEATTGARAVAGFNTVACQFMPLFMCNPFEEIDPGMIFVAGEDSAEGRDLRRRQIQFRMIGGGADYFPGNFAFLMADDTEPGADALRDALARVSPPTCFNLRGVDTKTGQNTGPVSQGLNVRFDIYDGKMNSNRNVAAYRPARNVRKGYEGNACNASYPGDDNPDVQELPRDDCFAAPEGCTDLGGGRLGEGVWDWQHYWEVNFCHDGLADCPEGAEPDNSWGNDDSNRPSRYEVYRYEIENDLLNVASRGGEVGAPQCSDSATNDSPDRRLIVGAIINCNEHGPLNGHEEDVPVLTFAEFFLTEAVQAGGDGEIMTELRGLVEPGGENPALHDIVQLYR